MFYPSLTSTDKSKIPINLAQINKLNINSICLFLTCLEKEERAALFAQLRKSPITNIPFVHLRSDMDEFEIDYLIKHFKTQVFNIHSEKEHPLKHDLSKYKDQIYIENTSGEFDEETIKHFAGICIDFTHLEQARKTNEKKYNKLILQIEKYPCKCCHISAIKQNPVFNKEQNKQEYDFHLLGEMAEIDYLIRYKKYFPKIMALELENTIEKQLAIINHLNENLFKKG